MFPYLAWLLHLPRKKSTEAYLGALLHTDSENILSDDAALAHCIAHFLNCFFSDFNELIGYAAVAVDFTNLRFDIVGGFNHRGRVFNLVFDSEPGKALPIYSINRLYHVITEK